jgi:hypothetical protein
MACFDDCTLEDLDALAWLDAPSTSDDDLDMLLLALPPTPKHEPALQHQGFSPPQVVPKALPSFPGPQDAPAAAMQDCWGPAQQAWGMQEPCAAISSTPVMDLDSFLRPDAPAAACQWAYPPCPCLLQQQRRTARQPPGVGTAAPQHSLLLWPQHPSSSRCSTAPNRLLKHCCPSSMGPQQHRPAATAASCCAGGVLPATAALLSRWHGFQRQPSLPGT